MDIGGIDSLGVIQRRIDSGARLGLAPDQRRQAVLAGRHIALGAFNPSMRSPVSASAALTGPAS